MNDLDPFVQIPAGIVCWSIVKLDLTQLILTVVPLHCELCKFSGFVFFLQNHFRSLGWFEQDVPYRLWYLNSHFPGAGAVWGGSTTLLDEVVC